MFIVVHANMEAFVVVRGKESLQPLAPPTEEADVLILDPLEQDQRHIEKELTAEDVVKVTLLRFNKNGGEQQIYLREKYLQELIDEWHKAAGTTPPRKISANAA